jgi:hypothetical protein
MTHDELLKRLWEKRNSLCDHLDVHFALSAVVELHKPIEGNEHLCSACWFGDGMMAYPCLTIQAIEKELG